MNQGTENTDEPAKKSQFGKTHFGFQQVDSADKATMVRGVFDAVADQYDLMNDLMSGGIHRLWKNTMVDWLTPYPGMHVLDVAGGTGDIAFRILDRLGKRSEAAPAHVTVCDINHAMLTVGQDRALKKPLPIQQKLDWLCANAEKLPLPSAQYDAYTIAFGIRNVTHMDKALKEARRVLKPGGRFLCLEFSKVSLPLLDKLYETYSFDILPRLGEWVAGEGDAYRYLVESIERFPDQDAFKVMIEEAGFSRISVRSLSGGIAALHSAWRI